MQRTALAVLLIGGLGLTSAPMGAQAQTDQDDPSRVRSSSRGIEEIVVTARKREESLQDTPVSVTAFTTDMLQDQQITDLADIGEATPNLVFDMSTNSYNPRIYIRGVGSDDGLPTIDPGVGVYVDGVYIARTVSLNLDLLDIERVEVLRGPQGTLYGRNTIGGAINITSAKPTGEWGSKFRANVGNYGQLDTSASIEFPIIDERLSGRVSFGTTYNEGFFRNNFGSRSDWSNDRGLAGRGTFMLTPNDWSSYQLVADRTQKRSHPSGVNPNSICELNNTAGVCAALLPAVAVPLLENSHLSSNLNSSAGSVFTGTGGPSSRSQNDVDSTGVSLISSYDLGEATELKLTTAYRRLETRETLDVDGLSLSILDTLNHQLNNQASQEFQLNTTLFDGRGSLVSGVFLFYEDSKLENQTNTLSDTALQAALGAPGGISATTAGLSSVSRQDQTTKSYAAYGTFEYDLTDRVAVEAGLRYTYDHKRFKLLSTLRTGAVTTNQRDTEHWDDWSPMAGIKFQATDDMLLYAKWSRGFRSGQFNGRGNGLNALTQNVVEPETVKVTEVGMKSSWLDNRVIFNLAAFRNNFTDNQLTTFTTDGTRFVSLVQNAGTSRILGAEADLVVRATNDLTLFGSVGVLDAKYQTFREPVLMGANVGSENDVSDRDFKNTPELSFNLAAEYTIPAPIVSGLIRTRFDYSHQSQIYYNTANTESIRQDKVGLLNGRIAWTNDDERIEVALWSRNLTGRKWDTFGLDLNSSLGFTTNYPAEPQRFGVEVTLRY